MVEKVMPESSQRAVSVQGMVACDVAGLDGSTSDLEVFGEGYLVIGDTIQDARSSEAASYLLQWLRSARQTALNGSFAFAVLDRHNLEFHMITDPLGSIPLYHSDPSGGRLLCSTRAVDMLRRGGHRRISKDAATQVFAFGYNIGETTLLEGTREVPPACVTTVSLGGTAPRSDFRYWRYRQTEGISTPREYDAQLEDAWDRIAARYRDYVARQWDGDVLVKLTAGGDSRLLLSSFLGVPRLLAATYGNRSSWDRFVAKSICRANGIPHYSAKVSGRECVDPVLRRRLTCAIGLRTGAFIATGSALVLGALPRRAYLHLPGHAGDAVAGSHMHADDERIAGGAELLNTILRRHLRAVIGSVIEHPEELGRVFRRPEAIREPLEQYLAECPSDEYPWASLQRWDFEFRQHRYVLSDAVVLRENGPVLLPYWDLEWVAPFERCSFDLLCNREHYAKFVAARCANLNRGGSAADWPINSKSARAVFREGIRGRVADALAVAGGLARRRGGGLWGPVRGSQWRYVDRVSLGAALDRIERRAELNELLDEVFTPEGKAAYREQALPSYLDTCELLAELLTSSEHLQEVSVSL